MESLQTTTSMVTLTKDGKVMMRVVLLIILVMLSLIYLVIDKVHDLSIAPRYILVVNNSVSRERCNLATSHLELLGIYSFLLNPLVINLLVDETNRKGKCHKQNDTSGSRNDDDRSVVTLEGLGCADSHIAVGSLVLLNNRDRRDEDILGSA